MDKEKGAAIIGRIVLVLAIISMLTFAGFIVWTYLTLRSCSDQRNAQNTGKKLYTPQYIESYLERRYDRNFTFVSEKKASSESSHTDCTYIYTDENGLSFAVEQTFIHGYMFNGRYEVHDKYISAMLMNDEEFISAVENSGFKYEFTKQSEYTSTFCNIIAGSDTTAEKAAEFVFGIAQKYSSIKLNSCKSYNSEWHNFYSDPLTFLIRKDTADGRILAQISPVTTQRYMELDEAEKKQFIAEAGTAFREAESAEKNMTRNNTTTEE